MTENPRAHGGATATSKGQWAEQKKKGRCRIRGIKLKVLVLIPGPRSRAGRGTQDDFQTPAVSAEETVTPVTDLEHKGECTAGTPLGTSRASSVRHTHLVCVCRY